MFFSYITYFVNVNRLNIPVYQHNFKWLLQGGCFLIGTAFYLVNYDYRASNGRFFSESFNLNMEMVTVVYFMQCTAIFVILKSLPW